MSPFNIERAFKWKKERGWDTLYIAVDFHDCLFPGKYSTDQELILAPYAGSVLRWATLRPDIKLIAFTCSYAKDFKRVNAFLNTHGINFNFLNCNPECGNTELASFSKKFYFNILLDDKAGFECETDWLLIINELKRIGEWNLEELQKKRLDSGLKLEYTPEMPKNR